MANFEPSQQLLVIQPVRKPKAQVGDGRKLRQGMFAVSFALGLLSLPPAFLGVSILPSHGGKSVQTGHANSTNSTSDLAVQSSPRIMSYANVVPRPSFKQSITTVSAKPLLFGAMPKHIARILVETVAVAVQSSPDGPRFLSDMKPLSVEALDVPPLPVKVRECESRHGIFLHPRARSIAKIRFDLGGRHGSLSGAAGINDSSGKPTESPLIFRIVADGENLWTSAKMQDRNSIEPFNVKIKDAQTVELQVECLGGDGSAHAVWFAVLADPAAEGDNNPELETLFPKPKVIESVKNADNDGQTKPTPARPIRRDFTDLLNDVPPAAQVKKQPVPTPAELLGAQKVLRDVMGKELDAAKSLEARSKVTAKLIEMGRAPAQSAPSTYAVLAAASGKVTSFDQLHALLQLLNERFEGDTVQPKADGLAAIKDQIAAKDLGRYGDMCLKVIAEAERFDHFDMAKAILQAAKSQGRRLNDKRFTAAFETRGEKTDELARAFELCRPWFKRFAESPDNIEAAVRCGQYECYVRRNWDKGLLDLARTAEGPLAKAIASDLGGAKSPMDCLTVGDGWWSLAEGASGLAQQGMQNRAVDWYRQIPPGTLQGLEAEKVTKRIAIVDIDYLAAWRDFAPEAKLAKTALGRYRLFITNLGSKERTRQGLLTIAPKGTVLGQNGQWIADWRVDGEQVFFDFKPGDGHLNIKPNGKGWIGHHHREHDKSVWGWELIPE